MYGAVDRLRATDAVAQRIEALIVEQRLAPGDALPPERSLASRLEVSRNILREALRTLGEKGLVNVVSGKGTFVREPSTEAVEASLSLLLQLRHVSLVELCDARAAIEPEMAALAAERRTDADIERINARMLELEQSGSPAEHVAADLEFHRAIAETSRHSVYASIADAVRALVTRSMLVGTNVPRAIDVSDTQHQAIAEAITAGDPDQARNAMRVHIAYVRDYVSDLEQVTVDE